MLYVLATNNDSTFLSYKLRIRIFSIRNRIKHAFFQTINIETKQRHLAIIQKKFEYTNDKGNLAKWILYQLKYSVSPVLIRSEGWSLRSSSLYSHYFETSRLNFLIGQKSGTSLHRERERWRRIGRPGQTSHGPLNGIKRGDAIVVGGGKKNGPGALP